MKLLLLCGEEVLGWGWEEREGKGREVGHVCTYRVRPFIYFIFSPSRKVVVEMR
jgi:hypothetical protein